MKIIIDERETALYEKCHSIIHNEGNNLGIQLLKQVLPLGDILIQTDEDKNVILIERKTFSDLTASIRDGRYEEQSYRLTYSSGFPLHNIVYLLEGVLSQVKDKKIVYSAMTSLYYFKGFSTVRTMNTRESAEWIVWTADKIERDFQKGKIPSYLKIQQIVSTEHAQQSSILEESKEKESKDTASIASAESNIIADNTADNTIHIASDNNIIQEKEQYSHPKNEIIYDTPASYCTVVKKVKKENITPSNIGEILLCQIPSVNSGSAVAIMKGFSSFPEFIKRLQDNPEFLNDIHIETNGKKRKIGKNIIDNVKRYLL